MRERRVAVRKSFLKTIDLKFYLKHAISDMSGSLLRADAPEFHPTISYSPHQMDLVLDWFCDEITVIMTPAAAHTDTSNLVPQFNIDPDRRQLAHVVFAMGQ